MKFAVPIFWMATLSLLGIAQGISGGEGTLTDKQLKRRIPDVMLQRHVHGFVYCPDEKSQIAEVSLRSSNLPSNQRRVQTDENGYFDFANVPAGRYELVIKNGCSNTTSAVDHFDVQVQAEPTMFKDCVLAEIIVQLKERSKPLISHRPTKNVGCA